MHPVNDGEDCTSALWVCSLAHKLLNPSSLYRASTGKLMGLLRCLMDTVEGQVGRKGSTIEPPSWTTELNLSFIWIVPSPSFHF